MWEKEKKERMKKEETKNRGEIKDSNEIEK